MDEAGAGGSLGFGLGWRRRGWRRFDGAGFVADGERAAEGIEEALKRGGLRQEFGDAGFGEEGFEVGPGEGGFVLEFAEKPAGGGRERRARFVCADAVAAEVGAGGAVFAGGEAGHGGADDAGGAVEAVGQHRGEAGELGVAAEAERDEADELGDDRGETGREIRGQEAWVGPFG